ncbi:putative 50S ribosomal protein L32 [Chlamydia psittaci 84-8471/1]|nr:putative 50S ribosomal protein L32 [Chlamydia psittaci 84-8471/1]
MHEKISEEVIMQNKHVMRLSVTTANKLFFLIQSVLLVVFITGKPL